MRYAALRAIEYSQIRLASSIVYASKYMRQHYSRVRGHSAADIVIPCIPMRTPIAAGTKDAIAPAFVYCGGLSVWQEFEASLRIFRLLQGRIPSATLTIITRQREQALSQVKEHGINNATVCTLPHERVFEILCQSSFAFLIREVNDVNSVASPMKLGEYIAARCQVITTNALRSYAPDIESLACGLTIRKYSRDRVEDAAAQIVRFIEPQLGKSDDYCGFQAFYDRHYDLNRLTRQVERVY
jgi:hypothetical protein